MKCRMLTNFYQGLWEVVEDQVDDVLEAASHRHVPDEGVGGNDLEN